MDVINVAMAIVAICFLFTLGYLYMQHRKQTRRNRQALEKEIAKIPSIPQPFIRPQSITRQQTVRGQSTYATNPGADYYPPPQYVERPSSNDGLLTGLLIGQMLNNNSHHDSPGRQQARREIEESHARTRDVEPEAPTGYSSQETYSSPEPDRSSYESTPSSYDSGGSSYDSGGSSYDSGGSTDSGGSYDSNSGGY